MNKKTVLSQTINSLLSIADELDKSKNYDEADTLTKIASNIIKKNQRTAEPYNAYNHSPDENGKLTQINNFINSMSRKDFDSWAETPNGERILNEKDRLEAQYEDSDTGEFDDLHAKTPLQTNKSGYEYVPSIYGGGNDYGTGNGYEPDLDDNNNELFKDEDYINHNGYEDPMEVADPIMRENRRVPFNEKDVDNDQNAQYFK